MTAQHPRPRRPTISGRTLALALLLGLTVWPAATGQVPRARSSTQRPEYRLVVKPNVGGPGTTLVIRGGPFGPERGGLRLMLTEQPSGSHAKPRQVELQIVQWDAKEVRARIPELPWRDSGRFAVVLLDGRTGALLARSGADFTLGLPGSSAPGAYPRSSARADDPGTARTTHPKDVRLLATPSQLGPGDAFRVTGADFGDDPEGRRLYLQVQGTTSRRVRVPVVVERWARKALELRAPEKLPAQLGPADLMLVDENDGVLGRGDVVLLDAARAARTTGQKAADFPSGGGTPAAGVDPRSRPDPGAGREGKATSGLRGGERGRGGNAGRPDPKRERREGSGSEGQIDPGARRGPGDDPAGLGILGHQSPGQGAGTPRDDSPSRRFPLRPALALGGGGAKGAFQVGVLKNLYSRGLSPAIITGTSVGALNGAKLAEGGNAIDDLVDVWRGITGNGSIYVQNPHLTRLVGEEVRDVCGHVGDEPESVYSHKRWFGWLEDDANVVEQLAACVGGELRQRVNETLLDINALDGLYLQRGLATTVMGHLSPDAVARSGIKLRLTAVERSSGDLRYFTENGDVELLNGSILQRGRTDRADLHEDLLKPPTVADGVMASTAIPLFFSPWHIDGGEAYWDGAVREGIPIHKALELGATDLIAIINSPREKLTTRPSDRYTLVIEGVRRAGDADPDDGSSGDYYARVKWGHHDWKKTKHYEDDRDVSPNWRFEDVFGEILIEIKDYDQPEHEDDVCDASTRRGDGRDESLDESWQDPRLLRIDLDPRRFTDARNPGRFPILGDGYGQIGDLITVTGVGESDPVEVSFRIVPGVPAASGYTKGLPGDLAPLAQAMALLTHQGSEVSATDLADLDLLDVLHQVAGELSEGTVVGAVKSFPLPRDLTGRAYMIPNYVLFEPPFTMGELQEFEPEAISFNIELGDTVARWTRVEFLDRLETRYDLDGSTPIPTQRPGVSDEWLEHQKRAAIMGLIRSRIDTWRAREIADGGASAAGERARCWRERYEALQAKANDLQIRPVRHSSRASP
jgi:predicted acylesterase/phospholipase RssA